jgi:hypothetical protein
LLLSNDTKSSELFEIDPCEPLEGLVSDAAQGPEEILAVVAAVLFFVCFDTEVFSATVNRAFTA